MYYLETWIGTENDIGSWTSENKFSAVKTGSDHAEEGSLQVSAFICSFRQYSKHRFLLYSSKTKVNLPLCLRTYLGSGGIA